MAELSKKSATHARMDSGVSVDGRPSSAPGSVNSFTARQFAEYEKRLAEENVARPPRAHLALPHGHPRPVTVHACAHDSFASKDFAAYEKRLNATVHEQASAMEAGTLPDSGITIELNNAVTLPDKRHPRPVRNLRHKILSVYRRISTLVVIANLTALVYLVASAASPLDMDLSNLATATSVNFFCTIAVRQEWVINAMYGTCLLTPLSAPLRLRRLLAKVYENGGLHSGTAYAGTAWFILLCATVTRLYMHHMVDSNAVALLAVSYTTLAVLATILVFALPYIRMRWHNHFEFTHRFLGWLSIGCIWALVSLVIQTKAVFMGCSFGLALATEPSFWFHLATTLLTISPWLLLRRVRFAAENLSDHAMRLNYHQALSPFRGVALAESPLGQYHSFATFPNPSSTAPHGQSIIVSKAGDWTAAQVADKRAERTFWLRGIPKTGVLGMCRIFRSVVIVTTGSGIGPCLAFLNLPAHMRRPCRILWSSPRPQAIYGSEICDSVRKCDPDALIWDTRAMGRPNMVQLTYNMYRESNAEAVFVISNPKLTKMLLYALESRDVPAFGPIWDS